MAKPAGLRVSWADRLRARAVGLARPSLPLAAEPDLRALGTPERGAALLKGDVHFGGARVRFDPARATIWTPKAPGPDFDLARHGFDWMEDLAALADDAARGRAAEWCLVWAGRYGRGRGPGWTPLAAARRLIRVLDLGPWIAAGQADPARRAGPVLSRMAGRDLRFLSARFAAAPEGRARIETCCALIAAAAEVPDDPRAARAAGRAQAALEPLADGVADADGALASRDPEALADIFGWLARAADALDRAGPRAAHARALTRMAPALRGLRHADGRLPRFHGGDGGDPVRIDAGLAIAGAAATAPRREALVMGYARLKRGRTTVVVDAAPPPLGPPLGAEAHASTLALELTSGRRPVIVNCGSGRGFGPDWHRAARSTPSHSTLVIDGRSSARMGGGRADRALMVQGPRHVEADFAAERGGIALVAGHDGYVGSHGLIHVRRLDLDARGRRLDGEDMLTAVTAAERRRFDAVLAAARPSRQTGKPGLEVLLRFHLHPDVSALLDRAAGCVRLDLRNGESWAFSAEGGDIRLDPGVYLENTRAVPAACQQIVVAARATRHVTRIAWSLAKTDETPDFLRDDVVAAADDGEDDAGNGAREAEA